MPDAQQLVDLLRRAAQQNGGDPPGSRRFFADHQLTETDLRPAGFAGYSELVRSAGLEPPTFRTDDYTRVALLEAPARLARQLGRFPTSRERDVVRKRDESFPGDSAFRRLARAGTLQQRLNEWCAERDGALKKSRPLS